MPIDQIPVNAGAHATLLVDKGDAPALVINLDQNNTVFLVENDGDLATGTRTVPLPPGGTASFSGDKRIYGICLTGQTATVARLESGLNFFNSVINAMTGSLIRTSAHSPNYVVGTSGWTINKDGSAEFNNGTFRGNIVGGALYIYSGTPGLGNSPQLAIVPPGTVNDPYGNPVTSSKILMQGNVITESGGIFRTAAAAPLIQLDGPHNCIFVYDSSARLIASLNPGASTNDGLGHTVFPGLVVFDPPSAVYTQVGGGGIGFGTAAQLALTGGAFPGFVFQSGPAGQVKFDSGGTATGDTDAFITLLSKNNNGQRVVLFGGPAVLSSEVASALVQQGTALVYDDQSGYAHTKSARTGDTNNYIMGKVCTFATTDDSIASTSFADVMASLTPIGAGKYRITARMTCVAGATGPDINKYRVGWTGTISQVRMKAVFMNDSNPGNPVPALTTANNGALGSPSYPINTTYVVDIEGIIVTTSTGNISIQAAETTAGSTFKVLALSDFCLEPIG